MKTALLATDPKLGQLGVNSDLNLTFATATARTAASVMMRHAITLSMLVNFQEPTLEPN